MRRPEIVKMLIDKIEEECLKLEVGEGLRLMDDLMDAIVELGERWEDDLDES